ncbi:hypothetical protein [Nocardia sp. BMG111209]|uniref:hypothetical protein n=1 Tax=Nocardia sp. BMG111209 TaxID=1160137 RepID=UPI000367B58A|nr:hypothetical protein [Nocardia sp. BMG111209]
MSTGPHDYSAAEIKKTTWGELHELDDGRWKTVWRLTFTAPPAAQSTEVFSDETIGFRAMLQTHEGTSGELLVFTDEQAMSAIYYSPTFKSLGIVNDDIAELQTIENHPKEWYAPFRHR